MGRKRREDWFEHVRRAQREGKSLAEYARSIEVAPRVLYYWSSQLRREMAEGAEQAAPMFSAVRVAPETASAGAVAVLRWAGGLQLRLSSLPSAPWLAALARELRGADAAT